jgi:hypothetical protein
MINISFCILANTNVDLIIDSIVEQKVPVYEIIVYGNTEIKETPHITVIQSKECEERCWITKKKNALSKIAQYEWVVMLKDYIKLEKNWYTGFVKYLEHNKPDIVMNKIINNRNYRHIDWVWNNPQLKEGRNVNYNIKSHPKMFVPGSFLCAKREILIKYPFSEKIVGLRRQSDVEWSVRALKHSKYEFNPYSVCRVFTGRGTKYKIFRQPCKCDLCNQNKN